MGSSARRVLLLALGVALSLDHPTAGGVQTAAAASPARSQKQKAAPPNDGPAQKPYEPRLGQDGKNVVWDPTEATLVERMLDMAKVTPQDYVIDLGSGDGRTVIAAAKRGATAHGVEFNPDLVALSNSRARLAGVADRVTFEKADLFQADLSRATVITLFLMEWINLKLRPKLLQLKPGTRIVSNTFTMGEWKPDDSTQVTGHCDPYCTARLWIVPARVEGTWQVSPGRLQLSQSFQEVTGTLAAWGTTKAISRGRVRGDRLTFAVAGSDYDLVVNGNTLQGTVTTGSTKQPLKATKGP
jgi:hypothetical protein